jgi:hypothetical protein
VVPVSRGGRGTYPDVDDTVEVPELLPRPRREPAPLLPVAYAYPETPATGLRKFNLGTIPASVTPPRTWRRAAWFAVGTAGFVVLALGFAAIQLVGNPKRNYTIDALPGQPSQQLLITDLPIDSPNQSAEPTPSTRPSEPTRSSSATPTRTTNRTTLTEHADGAPARPVAPDRPLGTVEPVQPTTAPPRSTISPAPMPSTDPEKLGDRTELYYKHVCDNPQAAYQLTTGAMRAEGPEGIVARYGNVERIEVKDITIDPNWSVTRSTLTVVRDDGTTFTIRRELTFTSGPDPRISSDTAAA